MSDGLMHFEYETEDEELDGWYMLSIEVDGIESMAKSNSERTVVVQPMFELKHDLDATPSMKWNPNLEVDEEIYLKTGKVTFKN